MPHSLDIIVLPLGGVILKPKIERVEKKETEKKNKK